MKDNIRITTQELKARQEEWLAAAGRAKRAFTAAADTADEMEACFFGQQAHNLKTDFLAVKGEGEKAFGILFGHLEKLSTIAAVYDGAERSNLGIVTDN